MEVARHISLGEGCHYEKLAIGNDCRYITLIVSEFPSYVMRVHVIGQTREVVGKLTLEGPAVNRNFAIK